MSAGMVYFVIAFCPRCDDSTEHCQSGEDVACIGCGARLVPG